MRLRDVILSLSCALLVGCASAPPMPSQASFTQQILDPLSSQIADQILAQRKAAIASGQLNATVLGTLGSIIAPILGFPPRAGIATGSALAGLQNSSIEQRLALLESRRPALKRELLTLFQQRTMRIENGFAVCVDGQERRYVVQDGGFVQLFVTDPEPCERTPLTSLQLP